MRRYELLDSGSFWSELSSFFECAEGLFDGIKVWRVAREEEQMMACFFSDGAEFFLGMKRRVIHHDNAGAREFGQQRLAHPRDHGKAVAAVRERHRREPLFLPLRHDEVGGFAIAAGHIAEDFYAALGPAVPAVAVCFKPALINIDKVLLAAKLWQQAAQLT